MSPVKQENNSQHFAEIESQNTENFRDAYITFDNRNYKNGNFF